MQRLFGSRTPRATSAPSESSAPAANTRHGAPKSAVETFQETRDLLEKREAHVLRLVSDEIEQARAHQAGNRRREALECIKRKRIHEKELERLSVQKLNIMQQEQMLQQVRFTAIVRDAEEVGAAALEREIRRTGGVEGVEKLQDRLEDLFADGNDLLEAAAKPMGDAASQDEAELLEELEALELEHELQDTSPAAGSAAGAGSSSNTSVQAQPVPQYDPRATRRAAAAERERHAEERELAELTATMAVEQAMPMPMMAAPMPRMAACY